ncbi:MAG: hypothetical protein IPM24_25090 [Bryobacterales bacterium]|nr:hypothetical protein [Bryobacterales bacterium]
MIACLERHISSRGSDVPLRRPAIPELSEAAMLRIEAAVLEVEAEARDKILAAFATMLPTQEHIDGYQTALDSDDDNGAKWITFEILRKFIGFPIFEIVAEECLEAVPHTEIPASLEKAAQFAMAHMPPDDSFVSHLRSREFKTYLAKATRRAAVARVKRDTDTARIRASQTGGAQTSGAGGEEDSAADASSNRGGGASSTLGREKGLRDIPSLTDPIWRVRIEQKGPLEITRLDGTVDRIDPSETDAPAEHELHVAKVTTNARAALRAELEALFSGPEWPPVTAIIEPFKRYAIETYDVNAETSRQLILSTGENAEKALNQMCRNLLTRVFGGEWEHSPGERVVRTRWMEDAGRWKGKEIVVPAGNDPDPNCEYHKLIGDAIKHRYRFHDVQPVPAPGEPPGIYASNLE